MSEDVDMETSGDIDMKQSEDVNMEASEDIISLWFGLDTNCWAHIWENDGKKLYISSYKIQEVGNTTLKINGITYTFNYKNVKHNYWTNPKGNKFMMIFGGSPREDENSAVIAHECAEYNFGIPVWLNSKLARATKKMQR